MYYNMTATKLGKYHMNAPKHDSTDCIYCLCDFEKIAKIFEGNGLRGIKHGENWIKFYSSGQYRSKEITIAYNLITFNN